MAGYLDYKTYTTGNTGLSPIPTPTSSTGVDIYGGQVVGSGISGYATPISIAGQYAEEAQLVPTSTNNYVNSTPTPTPTPTPVYRDNYGNVRSSQEEANAVNQRGANARQSAQNYIGANDVQWGDFQTGYGTRGRNMVDTATGTQGQINTSRGNNALNLRRSMAAIANGVRQGLRSGGVNLANMNALDSGAAEAMARAWARAGGGQVGDARNSAAAQNRVLDTDQDNLARYMRNEMSDLSNYGRSNVNTSRVSLDQNLNSLATGLQDIGLQGQIDTNADDVWADNATRWLLEQDAAFQGQLGGVKAWTPEEINARAYEWDMAGREGTSPFAIDGVNTSIQDIAGAPVSQLPIYTRRNDERSRLV